MIKSDSSTFKMLSKRTRVFIATLVPIIIVAFLTYALWYIPTRSAFADYRALEKWTIEERAIIESNMLYIMKANSLPNTTITEEYDRSGVLLFIDAVRAHGQGDVWEVGQTHSDIFFGTATYSVFYFSDNRQMWVLNCDKAWHPLKE